MRKGIARRAVRIAAGAALLSMAGMSRGADEDFSVAAVFSNHMVLQRDKPLPVWGTAAVGTKVSVAFGGAAVETVAGTNGEWCATLPPMSASRDARSLTLSVRGTEQSGNPTVRTVVFSDVLVGDVWLCSGQSNMEFAFSAALDAKVEAGKAAAYPDVRCVKFERCRAFRPVKRVRCGKWTVCTSNALMKAYVTAVGYYMARELNRRTGVPQGILDNNWGGCKIEPYIPLAGLKGVPQLDRKYAAPVELAERRRVKGNADDKWWFWYRQECAIQYGKYLEECRKRKVEPEYLPFSQETMEGFDVLTTTQYNAMIAPIVRFPIAGALWYQGESNIGQPDYGLKLEALAAGWRQAWGYDFPLCIFQLSSVNAPNADPSQDLPRPRTRDDQLFAARRIKDCGFVVTMDIGARFEHPRNKRDAGERAALWALNRVYGQKDVLPSGPIFSGFVHEGAKLRVSFAYADGGLVAAAKDPDKPGVAPVPKDTKNVKGFALRDEKGRWHAADAVIDGASVLVSAPGVKTPKAVRYAHMDNTIGLADLYNAQGLPAAAFRSDSK